MADAFASGLFGVSGPDLAAHGNAYRGGGTPLLAFIRR